LALVPFLDEAQAASAGSPMKNIKHKLLIIFVACFFLLAPTGDHSFAFKNHVALSPEVKVHALLPIRLAELGDSSDLSNWIVLRLMSPKNSYKRNESIILEFEIVNLTANLNLIIHATPSACKGFKFSVMSSENEIFRTPRQQLLDKGAPSSPRILPPGSDYRGSITINEIFEMNKSGSYRIGATRQIEACLSEDSEHASCELKSNILIINIED
jgi:hypothetical protein